MRSRRRKLAQILLVQVLRLSHCSALYTIPPVRREYESTLSPATSTLDTPAPSTTVPNETTKDHLGIAHITPSAVLTIDSLVRNPLALRQKCFNDQGFSVNCATWTGYYYTWGPSGDPYRGGPGNSGGSGSGGTTYVGAADRKPPSATLYTAAISFSVLFQLL